MWIYKCYVQARVDLYCDRVVIIQKEVRSDQQIVYKEVKRLMHMEINKDPKLNSYTSFYNFAIESSEYVDETV
jgi:hypothetical protein